MNNIEKIQLFLKGKLNGEALEAFEKQLLTDRALQEEVADYKVIFNGLDQLRKKPVQEKFQKWSEALPNISVKNKPGFISRSIVRKIAAAAVVIVLAGVVYFMMNRSQPLEKFVADNYVALDVNINRNSPEDAFPFAQRFFKEKEYQLSIVKADEVTSENPTYLSAQYFKAHALYKLEQYEAAIKIFDQLPELEMSGKYLMKDFNPENAMWTSILAKLAIYNTNSSEVGKKDLTNRIKSFLEKNPREEYKTKAEGLQSLLDE